MDCSSDSMMAADGVAGTAPVILDQITIKNMLTSVKKNVVSREEMEAAQGADGVQIWQRDMTVQWLFEVGDEFQIPLETIAHGVVYLDKYLARRSVQKERLQLLACAATIVACKQHEFSAPSMADFAYVSGNCFTIDSLKQMELSLLKKLDWCLPTVTPRNFLDVHIFALDGAGFQRPVRLLAEFLVDFCQCYGQFTYDTEPQFVAAAALILAARLRMQWDIANDVAYVSGVNVKAAVDFSEDIKEMAYRKLPSIKELVDADAKFQEQRSGSPISVVP